MPPTRICEEPSKRCECSKHYRNADGSYTAEICAGPIHYKDKSDRWQDIDTAVVASDDPDYDLMNVTNSVHTYFGSGGNVKIVKGDIAITVKSGIGLALADADARKTDKPIIGTAPVQTDDVSKVSFAAVFAAAKAVPGKPDIPHASKDGGVVLDDAEAAVSEPTIDIDYKVLNSALHEEFVVSSPMGFPEIAQQFTLTNAYARREGKTIYIHSKSTGGVVGTLPPPVMFEKDNPSEKCFGLDYKISGLDTDVLTITKVLEPEGKDWFFSPDRTYPLVVDADFVAVSNYSAEGSDASYSAARASAAMNNSYLHVGQYYGGTFLVMRGFLKFDTSAIGAGNTVTGVTLKLAIETDYSTNDFDVCIAKCNWAAYDPVTSYGPSAYTACGSAALDSSIWQNTASLQLNTQYSSGALSADWINLTGYTYYGLVSARDRSASAPGGGEFVYFCRCDNANTALRPTLSVTYIVPTIYSVTGSASAAVATTVNCSLKRSGSGSIATAAVVSASPKLTLHGAGAANVTTSAAALGVYIGRPVVPFNIRDSSAQNAFCVPVGESSFRVPISRSYFKILP